MGRVKQKEIEKQENNLAPLPKANENKTYRTSKERVTYHREEANKAFQTDDKVKAYGHVKAHARAREQLNWWMKKSPEEKAAYIAEKNAKKAE